MSAQHLDPAFPTKRKVRLGEYATTQFEVEEGMTLRDYFAAKAMQASMPFRRKDFEEQNEYDWDVFVDAIVADSYAIADAMLKARSL